MKKTLSLLLLALVLFQSCGNDDDDNNQMCGSVAVTIPTFSGYVSVDNFGNPTNVETDPSDWRLDDTWSSSEQALFSDYANFNDNCPTDSNLVVFPAYPNPTATNLVGLASNLDNNSRLRVRVVDQQFNVLHSQDSITNNNVNLNFSTVSPNDDFVRVYYMVVQNENCIYLGHGDIRLGN